MLFRSFNLLSNSKPTEGMGEAREGPVYIGFQFQKFDKLLAASSLPTSI